MITTKPKSVSEYIASFPEEIQEKLKLIRATIQKAAPEAEETISYAMPTYKLHGNLIHFAAYKNHIGLYPAPLALEIFKDELSAYKGSKGAVQFPLSQPIPLSLIERITKYRVESNIENAKNKRKKTKN